MVPRQWCWGWADTLPMEQCDSRERGLTPNFLPLLEMELIKHQTQEVKSAMPVRQATEMGLATGPGAKGTCPGYRIDQRDIETGCPSGRRSRHQPHAATCSEPALPSVWLSALSAAAPKAEGKEESREKAQLVDEQREACRKPSPQNTSNH